MTRSAKQTVSTSFAVAINFVMALFALLSKRKKEKHNKLMALRIDVTS